MVRCMQMQQQQQQQQQQQRAESDPCSRRRRQQMLAVDPLRAPLLPVRAAAAAAAASNRCSAFLSRTKRVAVGRVVRHHPSLVSLLPLFLLLFSVFAKQQSNLLAQQNPKSHQSSPAGTVAAFLSRSPAALPAVTLH
ncbi:hypothetical protein Emag_000556 [Eimeria magna]